MALPTTMHTGTIFNIQRFSLQDGPGIRTTVFLKGCPLCCAWCHNPEGMKPTSEIVIADQLCVVCGACRQACPFVDEIEGAGPLPAHLSQCIRCGACVEACPTSARQMLGRTMTVQQVMQEVVRDRIFHEESGGGVTFSGGEPLAQPHFVLALLEASRASGLHTALDTTGYAAREHLLAAAALSDVVLYDLKAFDESLHQRFTGVSNRRILENLHALDAAHMNIWIRLPLVPGFNDDPADLQRIAGFVAAHRHVTAVNVLPFHRTGVHKFERLGLSHQLSGVGTPSPELLRQVAAVFQQAGLMTKVGG